MDALIEGGLVIAMDPDVDGGAGELGIVADGAVAVADGEIAYVGPASGVDDAVPGPRAGTVVDATGGIVLPGLVNAHAHTGHTLIRGAAQDLPEIEWMDKGLGPIANRMTGEDRVVGARLGVAESLASGATTVCEYAGEVGRLVESVHDPIGVRCVATETINEVPDDRAGLGPREPYPFDRERGEAGLERAEALFERYDDCPLVTPAYGPQALDMVSLELLGEIDRRAADRGRRLHMHVAQGGREAAQIAARYGDDASTVAVLEREGLLSTRLTAAHLHGATAAERRRLADAGVRMVGCPSSIAAIDGVVPPMAEYRGYGGTVGVGTDQAPGPGGHNLPRELRTAALLSKTDLGDPTAVPAWEALRLATVGGAAALGIADRVGTLTEGKRADIAVFDATALGIAPTVTEPFHTAVPNLVYGATGAEAREVFVDGRRLVDRGELTAVDADELVAAANARAERVFREARADWRRAGSALVDDVDAGRL